MGHSYSFKQKPDDPFELSHGHPVPSIQLLQPGYPVDLGSVAFRPTIARGLALSTIFGFKLFLF
jgi:hypothetical protein